METDKETLWANAESNMTYLNELILDTVNNCHKWCQYCTFYELIMDFIDKHIKDITRRQL